MTTPKKEYANETRDTDKSLMDTLSEIGTAVMEGFRGAARNRANPASEGSRARNRMEKKARDAAQQRGVMGDRYREAEGKAYGGKAKKMAKGGKLPMVEKDGKKVPFYAADGKGKMAYGGKAKKMMYGGKAHGKKK